MVSARIDHGGRYVVFAIRCSLPASDHAGDVVVAAPLERRLDEPLGRPIRRAGADERGQLVVVDQVTDPVGADDEHIAVRELPRMPEGGRADRRLVGTAPAERAGDHVREARTFSFLRRKLTGFHEVFDELVVACSIDHTMFADQVRA